MSKIQVTLQDYHDLLEKGLVDKTAVYEIRSQDDLNHQGRDSEVLISAIDELEKTKKQLFVAITGLVAVEDLLQAGFTQSPKEVIEKTFNEIKELDK